MSLTSREDFAQIREMVQWVAVNSDIATDYYGRRQENDDSDENYRIAHEYYSRRNDLIRRIYAILDRHQAMEEQTVMERVTDVIPANLDIEVRYEGDSPTTLWIQDVEAMRTFRAFVGKGHASEYKEGWGNTRAEAIATAFDNWKAMNDADPDRA